MVFAIIILIKLGSCPLLARRLCTKLFSWGPRRAYLSFYLFTCWLISHITPLRVICAVFLLQFSFEISNEKTMQAVFPGTLTVYFGPILTFVK